MSDSALDHLLAELCKTIALPEFVPDEDDYYRFSVDGEHVIEIKHDPDTRLLHFFVQLGGIHPEQEDEILEEILDANVLWRGTGGVTLGRDSTTGFVTLSFQENIEHMSYQRFEEIFGTMISNAEFWSSRIRGEAQAGTQTPSPEKVDVAELQWIRI